MTFLPIVHRELRIASRKRGTYLSRAVVAGVVILLWLAIILANTGSMPIPRLALILFWTYGILVVLYALLAGVFFTADALSAERRDGTLGLLFLTQLRGADVVLGKMCATSWHGVYSLLVVLPVLALPVLMGGVSVMEMLRLVVLTLSCLFYSLSLGLLVSTFCRRLVTGVVSTFLLLFVQCVVPWLAMTLMEQWFQWAPGQNPVRVVWPFGALEFIPDTRYHFVLSGGWFIKGPTLFWGGVGVLVMLGTFCLVTACLLLPRRWRSEQQLSASRLNAGRHSGAAPDPDRESVLDVKPCHWLFLRDRRHQRWLRGALVSLVILWVGLLVATILSKRSVSMELWFTTVLVGLFLLHVLVKNWLALESSRRFCEERHSGALELLLVTPVCQREVVAGEKAALWRTFTGPLLLLSGASLLFLLTNLAADPVGMGRDILWFSEIVLYGGLILWLDALTIVHVGMLTGLRAVRHHRAFLAVGAKVLLPPWMGVLLFILFVMMPGGLNEHGFVFCARGWFVLCAFLDVLLIQQARLNLRHHLRRFAAGDPPVENIAADPAPMPKGDAHSGSDLGTQIGEDAPQR